MHLLIPFACSDAPGCTEALQSLRLPHLESLLQRLALVETDGGAVASLSPPHERALARLCGLAAADGCIPWAAREARRTHPGQPEAAWAWISPVHWKVGAHQIDMTDPAALALDEEASRTLLAAMAPYFAEDGIALHYAAPQRWLAQGPVFDQLPSASLDRVVGRDIRHCMPAAPALRRLQNEMQMLLYTHPVNDARSAQGQLAVNSFWVSGTGKLPHTGLRDPTDMPVQDDRLRDGALRGDWAAWARAWAEVDQSSCAELLDRLGREPDSRITLCGERSALSFAVAQDNLLRRLQRRWASTTLLTLRNTL